MPSGYYMLDVAPDERVQEGVIRGCEYAKPDCEHCIALDCMVNGTGRRMIVKDSVFRRLKDESLKIAVVKLT